MLNIYTVVLLLGIASSAQNAAAVESNTHSDAVAEEGRTAAPLAGKLEAAMILTSTEFEFFAKSLQLVKDASCRRDLNATLWGIVAGQPWAIAMYDATAKSAIGIESGILHQFGHFDECLDRKKGPTDETDVLDIEIPVRAKYCLTDVTLDGLTVHNIATRNKTHTNQTAHWGACVPATCSASDVAIYLENLLQRQVAVDERMCQLQQSSNNISDSMFAYAAIMCFLIFLTVLSTSYHIYLICADGQNDGLSKPLKRNETLDIALLSFSIIENTKKLFQASKDQLGLNSINGIKALAMLLILAGHALSFIYGSPLYNAEFISENTKSPAIGFLSNSLLFVDLFLLLSGFLFCRILLIELERRRGRLNVFVLYLARYIRLTPAYMAIIGFYMTWFPSVGSGPIWQERIVREQERCKESWWLNILYINNYINTNNLCMFQSWYLSVDSQMFFVAPIAIYLLYKSRKYGLQFLTAVIAITAIIPFVVTFTSRLDPTLLVYSDEISDLGRNIFYVGSYIKTHMRCSAYFIGLLTGYLVHLMQEKSIKLPRHLVRMIWFIATVVGMASMFSVFRFYVAPFNIVESTMYAGCHRLGWNLSAAWLVLAATTGHAGWLQRVLSNRCFAPISRLTYCAYLSNGIVELYHSSSVRSPLYINYAILFNDVIAHIIDTLLLAFVLCLLFESPIHALERIMLRNFGAHKERSNSDKTKENTDSQSPSTSEEQVA